VLKLESPVSRLTCCDQQPSASRCSSSDEGAGVIFDGRRHLHPRCSLRGHGFRPLGSTRRTTGLPAGPRARLARPGTLGVHRLVARLGAARRWAGRSAGIAADGPPSPKTPGPRAVLRRASGVGRWRHLSSHCTWRSRSNRPAVARALRAAGGGKRGPARCFCERWPRCAGNWSTPDVAVADPMSPGARRADTPKRGVRSR